MPLTHAGGWLLLMLIYYVIAECLSMRHLIPLHCWIAFVCMHVYMYVCIYVQRCALVRGAVWVVTPLSTIHTGFCACVL